MIVMKLGYPALNAGTERNIRMGKRKVSIEKLKNILKEEIDRLDICLEESAKKRDFSSALEYNLTQEAYLFIFEAICGTNYLHQEILEDEDE